MSHDTHLDHRIENDHRAHRFGEHPTIEDSQTVPVPVLPDHVEPCPVCFPDGFSGGVGDRVVVGKADMDSACKGTRKIKSARFTSAKSQTVEKRDFCSACLPDGIPDSVQFLLTGDHSTSIHLRKAHEHLADESVYRPDEEDQRCHTNGLAAKLGSEDFGPDDLGLGDGASATGGD